MRELLDIGRQRRDSMPTEVGRRVEKVLALHGGSVNCREGKPYEYCPVCGEDSPCETVRVLNGEE
jgi:hypothetical protein